MINCDRVQAALSARLDGEISPLADDVVDTHLTGCKSCREYYETAALINRKIVFSQDPDRMTPDLADTILQGVESTWRRQASSRAVAIALSRVGLGIAGVAWMLWAVYLLSEISIGENDPILSSVIVEAAAMRCALGFGLLFAAWQSRIVGGILPIYGALWMFSVGFAVRDIVLGTLIADSMNQLALLAASVLLLLWCWFNEKGWALLDWLLKSA